MRKLNILKTITDIFWIMSFPIILLSLFFIPCIIISDNFNDFLIKISGLEIETIDVRAKFILVAMLISNLVLMYCLFIFRKMLRYFQKLKIFDEFVLISLNKIGYLLIICSFLSGVSSFVYKVFYLKKPSFNLAINPFILLFCLGLFFMILSEIFKISKKAKEENELTI